MLPCLSYLISSQLPTPACSKKTRRLARMGKAVRRMHCEGQAMCHPRTKHVTSMAGVYGDGPEQERRPSLCRAACGRRKDCRIRLPPFSRLREIFSTPRRPGLATPHALSSHLPRVKITPSRQPLDAKSSRDRRAWRSAKEGFWAGAPAAVLHSAFKPINGRAFPRVRRLDWPDHLESDLSALSPTPKWPFFRPYKHTWLTAGCPCLEFRLLEQGRGAWPGPAWQKPRCCAMGVQILVVCGEVFAL